MRSVLPLSRRDLLAGSLALAPARPRTVLLDQDGGMPDDYLATLLLAAMDDVRTAAVVVTPGDCVLEPAVSATRKLLAYAGSPDVPVAASTVPGVHPFPMEWRRGAYTVDRLPLLKDVKPAPLVPGPGQQYLARCLRQASEPLTLLVTGPLSTVAAALDADSAIEPKIRELVWMGGALQVPGNVEAKGHDGTAEWNAYWDPPAVARVWRSGIPIVLCPLDITNTVPVTEAFFERVSAQSRYRFSRLAADCLRPVRGQHDLYFWDVLATAYVGRPGLFHTREVATAIGPQGRTRIQPGGRAINLLDRVDVPAFHRYVLDCWAR